MSSSSECSKVSHSFDTHNKSSSSQGASSPPPLTHPPTSSQHSPHNPDTLAATVAVEADRSRSSSTCRNSTYQETHFDSSHCPLHPHHTLHIVRDGARGEGRLVASSASSVHLHTLPHHQQGTATLPHGGLVGTVPHHSVGTLPHHPTLPHHHPTLFECQHRCFQHPPEVAGGE